jgi:hypothetical protein
MKAVVAKQTLAEFSAFQLATEDRIGANTSTAIVNFLASKVKATGRTDLTALELSELVDPNDPDFQKLIRGKGFSKPMQLQLAKAGSELREASRTILKSLEEELVKPIGDLLKAQKGEIDPNLRASIGERRSKAFADKLLEDEKSIGVNARKIVENLLPIASPGILDFPRRMATRNMLKLEQDQLQASMGVARQAIGGAVFRENFGLLSHLAPLRIFGNTAATFGRSNEDLLRIRSDDPSVQAAQAMLRELIAIQQSQVEEQKFLAKEEANRRSADNARLVDTVGRATNAAAQGSRLSSEEEN